MYRLTKDGVCLGMTEAPTYIKQAKNGCYILCPEPEASGIAFNGVVYHLLGRDSLEGVETVMLEEVDGGQELLTTQQSLVDAESMNVDHEYRLALLELGLKEEV